MKPILSTAWSPRTAVFCGLALILAVAFAPAVYAADRVVLAEDITSYG
jgi:hypothetical protein